jgi:hypothetical protein
MYNPHIIELYESKSRSECPRCTLNEWKNWNSFSKCKWASRRKGRPQASGGPTTPSAGNDGDHAMTKPSHYQMRMAMLEVAEDPDRPGTIDVQRLERFLLNLQAKGVIDGRRLVSSQDANGERRWWVEEVH